MSSDFKLIMENWNNYVTLVESDIDTNIYLMNEGKFEKSSFSLLLEQADQGIISHQQMYEAWEKSFDYEMSLLEEQFMDDVKAGLGKAKQFITDLGAKLHDMYMTAMIQAYQMIQRSAEAGAKALGKVVGPLKRLAEENPRLAKVSAVAGTMMILFVMQQMLDESVAQAAIAGREGTPELNDQAINIIKGAASEIGQILQDRPGADKFEMAEVTVESILELEALAQSPNVDDITQLKGKTGALLKQARGYMYDLIDQMKNEDLPIDVREDAFKALQKLEKLGAAIKVSKTGYGS